MSNWILKANSIYAQQAGSNERYSCLARHQKFSRRLNDRFNPVSFKYSLSAVALIEITPVWSWRSHPYREFHRVGRDHFNRNIK